MAIPENQPKPEPLKDDKNLPEVVPSESRADILRPSIVDRSQLAREILVARVCAPPAPTAPATEPAVKVDVAKKAPEKTKPRLSAKTFFDNKPDYFRKEGIINGSFSPAEKRKRTVVLRNPKNPKQNVTLFKDIGLTFYVVQKGDSISTIRRKLIACDKKQFGYLAEQRGKLESFNIPAKSLKEGMLLPIPLKNKDRQLTQENFVQYCRKGLEELLSHPRYCQPLEEMLMRTTMDELLAFMLAIARQESGGRPLGKFEFHRWEKKYKSFSFSFFHILMEDWGLKARQELNLTEGQLYHPVNSAKLFMAYLIEKTGVIKDKSNMGPEKFFPFQEHLDEFAEFYNGPEYRKNNYVPLVQRYYAESIAMLNGEEIPLPEPPKPLLATTEPQPEKQPTQKVTEKKTPEKKPSKERVPVRHEKFVKIGARSMFAAVRDANEVASKRKGAKSILENNQNVLRMANGVLGQLKKVEGDDTYYPNDFVAVSKDKKGRYVIFKSAEGKVYPKIYLD